jgi:hypothetical protein
MLIYQRCAGGLWFPLTRSGRALVTTSGTEPINAAPPQNIPAFPQNIHAFAQCIHVFDQNIPALLENIPALLQSIHVFRRSIHAFRRNIPAFRQNIPAFMQNSHVSLKSIHVSLKNILALPREHCRSGAETQCNSVMQQSREQEDRASASGWQDAHSCEFNYTITPPPAPAPSTRRSPGRLVSVCRRNIPVRCRSRSSAGRRGLFHPPHPRPPPAVATRAQDARSS